MASLKEQACWSPQYPGDPLGCSLWEWARCGHWVLFLLGLWSGGSRVTSELCSSPVPHPAQPQRVTGLGAGEGWEEMGARKWPDPGGMSHFLALRDPQRPSPIVRAQNEDRVVVLAQRPPGNQRPESHWGGGKCGTPSRPRPAVLSPRASWEWDKGERAPHHICLPKKGRDGPERHFQRCESLMN